MSDVILLDSGPLGLVTNPKLSPQTIACTEWLQRLLTQNVHIVIPEIADYEVRRELIRANKQKGLQRLDALQEHLFYLPITTETMRHAAQLWAEARQAGKPTADRHALDGDVILAAQALSFAPLSVTVATTNVGHLAQFVDAHSWEEL